MRSIYLLHLEGEGRSHKGLCTVRRSMWYFIRLLAISFACRTMNAFCMRSGIKIGQILLRDARRLKKIEEMSPELWSIIKSGWGQLGSVEHLMFSLSLSLLHWTMSIYVLYISWIGCTDLSALRLCCEGFIQQNRTLGTNKMSNSSFTAHWC